MFIASQTKSSKWSWDFIIRFPCQWRCVYYAVRIVRLSVLKISLTRRQELRNTRTFLEMSEIEIIKDENRLPCLVLHSTAPTVLQMAWCTWFQTWSNAYMVPRYKQPKITTNFHVISVPINHVPAQSGSCPVKLQVCNMFNSTGPLPKPSAHKSHFYIRCI